MKKNVLVIVSQFNRKITESLYEGAHATLLEEGISSQAITRVDVPGAFELPFMAKQAALMQSDHGRQMWDGIICLGCVIQGETPHFDYVCQEAARGIMDVGLQTGIPVIFGVLTTNTPEQALARSGLAKHRASSGDIKPHVENKGVDAAKALTLVWSSLMKLLPENRN